MEYAHRKHYKILMSSCYSKIKKAARWDKAKEFFKLEKGDNEDKLDHERSFSKICRYKEYAFERHKVMTEDGYWLTLFRVWGAKGQSKEEALAEHKPIVLFQHGVVDSADTFIMNSEDKAPGFMVANQGYDVWFGNSRGNKYSREHQDLDPDDSEDMHQFFDYSFEEMAHYDVPAMIDYILKTTGKQKLAVLGHSQGATQMLVRMADDPDWWNERVGIFGWLGGVTKLEHTSSKLIKDLSNQKYAMKAIKKLKIVEISPNKILSAICKISPFIWDFLIELVADADAKLNNQPRVAVFMNHYPSGSSLKCFEHYAQIVKSGKFLKFDYEEENFECYGQATPPEIDLTRIRNSKIIQIVGTRDRLSPLEDNEWLREQLGDNVIYYNEYPLGHTSFLLAKDMSFMVDTINQLKEHPWE